jgi:hypothetical protein
VRITFDCRVGVLELLPLTPERASPTFTLLIFYSYERALTAQPQTLPDSLALKAVAAGLFVAGQILVLSSTWALGVTGVFCIPGTDAVTGLGC